MMLALLSLIAIAPLATADKTLSCAIDGAGALDSTIGAGVYLWASTQRCDKGNAQHSDIKCGIDVASAIKSVNDMVNIIVGAVNKCGDVHTKNAACGQAVGSLTSAAAGLGAATGGLAHWLIKKSPGGNVPLDASFTTVGRCVMDVKGVATGIFTAAGGFVAAKKGCKGKADVCAADALQVISILSSMGSAIAASVHHCSAHGNTDAAMSADILGLVGALNGVAQAGIAIEQSCKVEDARLYEAENDIGATTNNSMSLVLAALLPVAAMLGFVGGRRVQKKRMTRSLQLGEDVMQDTE